MKEGKQAQKYQIKVKTLSGVEKIFVTSNILNENRAFTHTDLNDIIRELADYSFDTHLTDPIVKIDQTTLPISGDNMIMVPTLMLAGLALDYALADVLEWTEPFYDVGKIRLNEDHYLTYDEPDPDDDPEDKLTPESMNHYCQWAPSRMMTLAGWLMKKYKISVKPTSQEVADPTIEATYQKSDFDKALTVKGATYEEAICLALVSRTNGKWTMIPADFEQYLTQHTV